MKQAQRIVFELKFIQQKSNRAPVDGLQPRLTLRIEAMNKLVPRALLALSLGLILSCGGGGGGAGGGTGGAAFVGPSDPVVAQGPDATSPIEFGFKGIDSLGGGSGDATAASNGGAASTSTASVGDGSGVGSGGTGATASGGDNSGVGSGGTGATASAGDSGDAGVGGVGGVGSIIINGVRYDTSTAILKLRDAPSLQLGMTVKVNGPTNPDFTEGVATQVESAVDLRGVIAASDVAAGSFVILGTNVITDVSTVLGNLSGPSALTPGVAVRVWGLPASPGVLRATRVEQHSLETPILSGTVQNVAPGRFTIGGLTIDTTAAAVDAAVLAGVNVRVRADAQPSSGVLKAKSVELWYPLSLTNGARRQLGGVVTGYVGTTFFRVLGVPVDASSAKVSGGPLTSLANGVEVDVAGTVSNGILLAAKIKVKKAPGSGGNSDAFQAIGPIGAFKSSSDFKVKGQSVNASHAQFVNGTEANLRNGTKVTITGDRIVNDVLMATSVVFD
ncbi:DUF5666 domain-containing protein [Variovorax sp. J22R24]|uniref:DUF5666 domain-containing protein n=1 Tax=Variovorax gracilis TaxID=3053502 RepID=UPI0025781587|nr:DUF5666 domain-containing protein [Variovorax sp. J22R24]MDM0110254.1 DUF5666 domain-containing protein [Variovorax sp. J22R24]